MRHVDEGNLQAYADGELDAGARVAVESHLQHCLACRSELEAQRAMADELSRGLLALEGAEPAARGFAVGFPNRRPARGWGRGVTALPRAAVLVLGFAAAASAMVPGSPLYRWLRPDPEVAAVAPAPPAAAPTPMAAASAPVAESAPEAGVSIEPLDGAVRVVVTDAAPALRIRALLTDSPRAGVYATGPAASARFETAPGRIEVTGAAAGELRVELPRSAQSAIVVVNGRDYLTKENAQLRLAVPAGDRSGTEVTFSP